jgi:uncharacterized protein YdaU (DUF1376 family)
MFVILGEGRELHYYKRNLGDYAKKAGRLSMLQHGAFNLLIDSCYDREYFPTLEEALDWTWASTQEEEDAIRFVLKKFFVLEGEIYVQKRIEEELEEYRKKQEANRKIALYREHCRRAKKLKEKALDYETWLKQHETLEAQHEVSTVVPRVEHDAPPNHKPVTTNQEPLVKDSVHLRFDEFWNLYPKKKDRKKAKDKWKSRNLDSIADQIISALKTQKEKDRNWLDGFIPLPTTYINGDRWNDEIEEKINETGRTVNKHQGSQTGELLGANDTSW